MTDQHYGVIGKHFLVNIEDYQLMVLVTGVSYHMHVLMTAAF